MKVKLLRKMRKLYMWEFNQYTCEWVIMPLYGDYKPRVLHRFEDPLFEILWEIRMNLINDWFWIKIIDMYNEKRGHYNFKKLCKAKNQFI